DVLPPAPGCKPVDGSQKDKQHQEDDCHVAYSFRGNANLIGRSSTASATSSAGNRQDVDGRDTAGGAARAKREEEGKGRPVARHAPSSPSETLRGQGRRCVAATAGRACRGG